MALRAGGEARRCLRGDVESEFALADMRVDRDDPPLHAIASRGELRQRDAQHLAVGGVDLRLPGAAYSLSGAVEHTDLAERRLDSLREPQRQLARRLADDA